MLTNEQARIRWQCRRGMLELDLLLMGFFDRHYLEFDPATQNLFDELLVHSDQELYDCLVKKECSIDQKFNDLIKRIYAATSSNI